MTWLPTSVPHVDFPPTAGTCKIRWRANLGIEKLQFCSGWPRIYFHHDGGNMPARRLPSRPQLDRPNRGGGVWITSHT
jgi:hypothetical protein